VLAVPDAPAFGAPVDDASCAPAVASDKTPDLQGPTLLPPRSGGQQLAASSEDCISRAAAALRQSRRFRCWLCQMRQPSVRQQMMRRLRLHSLRQQMMHHVRLHSVRHVRLRSVRLLSMRQKMIRHVRLHSVRHVRLLP